MIDTFSNAEPIGWLDEDGLLHRTVAVLQHVTARGVLALSALAIGGTAVGADYSPAILDPLNSGQYVVEHRRSPAQEAIADFEAQFLNSNLARVRDLSSVDGYGTLVSYKAIRAARIISNQIPAESAPQIGLDDEGNVFLHFTKNGVHAYLTIEPKALHLLRIAPGQPSISIDGEPLPGKRLPKTIRDQLAAF